MGLYRKLFQWIINIGGLLVDTVFDYQEIARISIDPTLTDGQLDMEMNVGIGVLSI